MSEYPLVSVVVVTYNQEKYIEQTLDCILAQETEYEYELLIGEDCSTDGTRAVVERYQRQHPDKIRIVTSEKNVGLMDNYYRTVTSACGKYLAICGGDDYWHNPEKLQKQIEFLEKNPEYGMVHTGADFFYQKSGRFIRNYHDAKGYCNEAVKSVLEGIQTGKYLIVSSSAAFRKSLFDKYFDMEEYKRQGFMMEDTPFWAALSVHSKIYFMPGSFMVYRLLEESVTQSEDRIKKLRYWISASAMHQYLCDKYQLPQAIKRIHEKRWCRMSLQKAYYEHRGDLADEVRAKCSSLTLKDWVWYWGVKHEWMRVIINVLQKVLRKAG